MGAGVDNVISDKTIPFKIPLCRIVDKQMAFSMSNYIIMAVLNYHRNWYDYDYAQKKKHWSQHRSPTKGNRRFFLSSRLRI